MFLRRSLLAIAIGTALPVVVMAADNAEEKPAELTAIEVKADVITEPQSTAQQVQVVSAKTLTEQQAQNLDDVVRFIPGVTTTQLGSRFGGNGFNIRGMEGDQIAITVDGLSLGETLDPATYRNYDFFRSTRSGIDIDSMKQVEIVKGADAIAAGSGALGGAVLFVTKDPADYLNAEGNDTHVGLNAGFSGMNDEVTLGGTIANRSGKLETLLVYTNREGHEAKNASDIELSTIKGADRNLNDPLDFKSDNVLAKLQYQLTDTQRVGVTGEYYKQSSVLNNLSRANDTTYQTRVGDDEVERKRIGAQYEWIAATTLADTLNARIDYQTSLNSGVTTILTSSCTGAANGNVSPCYRQENRKFEQDLLKLSLAADKELLLNNVRHQLIYGVTAERKNVESTWLDYRWVGTTDELASVTTDADQVPETDVNNYSLYLRDVISFAERWQLRLGARYDYLKYSPKLDDQFTDNSGTVTDIDFSSFTWQANLQYQITEAHQVWGQVARGFRAPTANDMFSPTSTIQATVADTGEVVTLWRTVSNKDLKAETSLNLELGYRYITPKLQFELSIFQDTYDNLIESVTKIQNPDVQYEGNSDLGATYTTVDNVGETEVKGFEVSASWRITDSFSSRFAYSYNEGEKKASGDPLQSIIPPSAVLGFRYDAENWNTQLNITHSEKKKTEDATSTTPTYLEPVPLYFSESFTVVDLMTTVDVTSNLQLRAGVYNLFDEEYMLWQRIRSVQNNGATFGGTTATGIQRYTEPGRHVKLSVSYRF